MGPAGAGGSGSSAGNASVFLPPNQGAAAGAYGDILSPLAGLSANAGAGTPGAWAYPQAQSFFPAGYNSIAQYLTGDFQGGQPTLYDSGAGQAYGSAVNAGNLYGGLMPDIYNGIPGLAQGSGQAASYLPQALASAFNPLYGQMVDATANNPFYAGAQAGAQQGAALGGQGAQQMQNAATGILQSGFDPQAALFQRTQRQLADQSGAANAMAGIGSSPYGAGQTANALGNFDINWQNNLLGRQTQAANAASPLLQQAPGLAAGSAALPSNTYLSQLGSVLNALKAQQIGQGLGASTAGTLEQTAGQGLGQANTLGQSIAGNTASLGALPYQTGATIGNNALGALGNLQSLLSGTVNIGNNQFQLPQQVLNDLQSYLGLGQAASGLSGQLGQMGFNQTAQGLGGALSGANALFGNNGLLGGGGLLGGLGGAGTGAANLTGAAALPGFDTLGGTVGMGALGGDFGGGSAIASLLPFAASA